MSEPYRDELTALRQRLEVVNTDLAEVKRRLQGKRSLEQEHEALVGEARELNDRIRRQTNRSLPMLDRVRVASPCDAHWDDMTGDAHRRHCAACDRHVYDLSSLTRAEAEALLRKHEGPLCVRFHRRADGTVLTSDCPVGVSRRRRRWVAFSALALGTIGTSAMFLGSVLVMGKRDEPMTGRAAVPYVSGSASLTPEPCPDAARDTPVDRGEQETHERVMGRMQVAPPAVSARPRTSPRR